MLSLQVESTTRLRLTLNPAGGDLGLLLYRLFTAIHLSLVTLDMYSYRGSVVSILRAHKGCDDTHHLLPRFCCKIESRVFRQHAHRECIFSHECILIN